MEVLEIVVQVILCVFMISFLIFLKWVCKLSKEIIVLMKEENK